jgi:hypothetical protein
MSTKLTPYQITSLKLGDRVRITVEGLKASIGFLENFCVADLEDLAADGGVTVGMVFQQQAVNLGVALTSRLKELGQ